MNKVLRGGSWVSYLAFARADYRLNTRSDGRYDDIGFRVISENHQPTQKGDPNDRNST